MEKELSALRKKSIAESRKYVEDYFEARLDTFGEPMTFSNNQRDARNMAVDMWLACGDVAVASKNKKLKQSFFKAATKAKIFEKQY
ncbi:MAG: hypothetical protein K0U39_07210 [Alphaproteobacteria bacterium]|nr:hypothetical protein [Alphaproteobacteria bacterium]